MVEEHWEPKTEDLEPIKVTREIPQIDILLKKSSLDTCDKELILCNENIDVFLDMHKSKVPTKKHKSKVKFSWPLISRALILAYILELVNDKNIFF